MYIVFADRSGQIRFLCWIFNFMRYGDWEIYRIRSPWEILQSFLQESDYCSVSAGSQHPIFIFICPLSAASIAVTDSGVGGLNKRKVFFSGKVILLKHWSIVLSPYGHYAFWVKLKLHFWAFSSKHRRLRVLWGFIKNFILTFFKIVYIYKLNFSFFFFIKSVS